MKKCAHETADLKFLNNQYVHKLKLLEKESKAKNEKIQQLQEKNLHAVVQTPGESSPSRAKLAGVLMTTGWTVSLSHEN